jgi:hypothetical protein
VLGKYLSPRLYVSYGDLADGIHQHHQDALHARRRWTVKTEAGKERSADLVYTIEKVTRA